MLACEHLKPLSTLAKRLVSIFDSEDFLPINSCVVAFPI